MRAYPTVLFEESLQVPLCFVRFADDDASCLARAVVVIHTVPVFFFFSAGGNLKCGGSAKDRSTYAEPALSRGSTFLRLAVLDRKFSAKPWSRRGNT